MIEYSKDVTEADKLQVLSTLKKIPSWIIDNCRLHMAWAGKKSPFLYVVNEANQADIFNHPIMEKFADKTQLLMGAYNHWEGAAIVNIAGVDHQSDTLLHEIGHLVDCWLLAGVYVDGYTKASETFAWRGLCRRAGRKDHDEYFAESFAALYGGGGGVSEEIKTFFNDTKKMFG